MSQTCQPIEVLIVEFQGRLDTALCVEMEAEVRATVTAPQKPVVFDLKGVDFVCSAFLRLCIYAYQQAGNQGFEVVNLNPSIKRVFKIAGLDMMLQDK